MEASQEPRGAHLGVLLSVGIFGMWRGGRGDLWGVEGWKGTLALSVQSPRLCLPCSAEGQQVPAGELLQQRAASVPDQRVHL